MDKTISNKANSYRNLTQKRLNDNILSEQAKENPKHDKIKKALVDREESDWNSTSPYSIKNISKNKEQELERLHRQFDGICGITETLDDYIILKIKYKKSAVEDKVNICYNIQKQK